MFRTKHSILEAQKLRPQHPALLLLLGVAALMFLSPEPSLLAEGAAEDEGKTADAADPELAKSPELAKDPVYQELLKINYVFNRELYDLAAPRYEKLLEENPAYPRSELIHYALALCYYNLATRSASKEPLAARSRELEKPIAPGQPPADQSRMEGVRKAIVHFKEAIKRKDFESRFEAVLLLGRSFLLVEDFDGAAKTFQWLIERSPPEKEERAARLGLADTFYSQSKHVQAAEAYREALKKLGEGEEKERAEFYLAMSLFRGKTPEGLAESAKLFKAISSREKSPYRPDARYMMAVVLEAQLDDEGALAVLRSLLSEGSSSYAELGQLGLASAYQRLGRHQDAIGEFQKFLAAFPSSERKDLASLGLARSLIEASKAGAAAKMLQELRSSPSVGDDASLLLARLYLSHQKARSAVGILGAALKSFPSSPRREDLELELASALLADGKFDAAREALTRFEKEHAGSSALDHAAYLKAYSLHCAKKYEESLKACGRLKDDYPRSKFLKDVAQLDAENHFLKGDHEKALESYREFLGKFEGELDLPSRLRARFRCAQALSLLKRHDEAQKLLSSLTESGEARRAFKEDPFLATYHYLLGDCAYQMKDYTRAREELGLFLKEAAGQESASRAAGLGVESSDARFKLAHSLELAGEAAAAQEAYHEALKADPQTPHREQIQFELGQVAYSQKQFEAASEEFGRLVAENPSSRFAPYALRLLGWMAFEREDYAAARTSYQKLLDSFPDHELAADAEFQLALSLQSSNNPAEARKVLRRLQEKHPGDPRLGRVLLQEAIALSKQKKHAEALASLEKLRQEPGSREILPSILYEIAWCHRALKDADAAVKAYEELISKDEAGELKERASFELAELEFERRQYARAKALLEPLSSSGVQREKVLYRLCWCHHALDEPEQAISVFEAFRKDFGSSELLPELAVLAAQSHVKEGHHAKAGEIFLAVAEARPGSQEAEAALVSYAECLAEERRFDEASERFRAFLERYPKSSIVYRARFGQAWSEENLGRLDEAMKKYHQVAQETTTAYGARAQFQLGQCLVAKKNLRDAIVEFLQVPASYSYPEWTSKALLQVAGAFEALEDRANAKKYYREVMASYPKRDEAKLARERLSRLEAE